jgi:hypothetical protein
MLSNLQLQITCISSGVLAQALLIQLDSARRPETSGQDQDKDEEKDEEKTCHVLDIEANLTSPTLNLGQKWVLSKHLKFEELETFPPVEGREVKELLVGQIGIVVKIEENKFCCGTLRFDTQNRKFYNHLDALKNLSENQDSYFFPLVED